MINLIQVAPDGVVLGDGAGGVVRWAPDEVGPLEAFELLSRDPSAEIVVAVDLRPRDPVTGEVVLVLLTTAPRLYTGPNDDPPNAIHRSLTLRGWSPSRALAERGKLVGSNSSFDAGLVEVDNSDGQLTFLQELDWNGAAFGVKVGGHRTADGQPYPYSLFLDSMAGVVSNLVGTANSSFEIRFAGRSPLLAQPLVAEVFRGFGSCLVIPDGEMAAGAGDAPAVVAVSVDWIGIVDGAADIFTLGTALSLSVSALGVVTFSGGGGVLSSGIGAVPVGSPCVISASVPDTGSSVRVYAGTKASDLALVVEAILPHAIDLGDRTPSIGGPSRPWEVRLWSVDRDLEAVSAGAESSVDPDAENLVETWRFEDGEPGIGGVVRGENGTNFIVSSPPCYFTSTLEGDDPVSFPGGPANTTKPDGWGPVTNIRPQLVSSQFNDYVYGVGPSKDLPRVYVNQAPLVPNEVLTSAYTGQISFTAPSTISFAGGLSGRHFVPGQENPQRDGQRIEVTGSGTNDGVYQVATVAQDGSFLTVVELTIVGAPSAPAGTVVRSYAVDIAYSYDLETSTIRTVGVPPGDLTADAVMRFAGKAGMTVLDALAFVLGTEVDATSLAWNPVVGWWLPPGSTMTRAQLATEIAASACAWWIEDRFGSYRVGTWRLPSGSPRATIGESRIASITELETVVPASRLYVGYGRPWVKQESGTLPLSIPSARRGLVSRDFQVASRSASAATLTQFPLAKPRTEVFGTYLTTRADAEIWLDYAMPLYATRKLRWFDIDVAGSAFGELDVDQCIVISHPDPTYEIVAGALARIYNVKEDPGTDLLPIEVFL